MSISEMLFSRLQDGGALDQCALPAAALDVAGCGAQGSASIALASAVDGASGLSDGSSVACLHDVVSPSAFGRTAGDLSYAVAGLAASLKRAASQAPLSSLVENCGRESKQARVRGESAPHTGAAEPSIDARLADRVVLLADGAGGVPTPVLVPLVELPNESRRLGSLGAAQLAALQQQQQQQPPFCRPAIAQAVVDILLQPRGWQPPVDRQFALTISQIECLCDAAKAALRMQPTCVRVRAPVKVFGDIHGQFGDLMRLFESFGQPRNDATGDLGVMDYLFLGDYVDRGSHSLETICLLLALKAVYPGRFHLLRGNHESADVNADMGFLSECRQRLGLQNGYMAWISINAVFDWLPLAAVIDDRILCVHGGVGKSLRSVSEIDAIKRPLKVAAGGEILRDLLWSDPTEHDSITGIRENPHRGNGTCTFGPDRVASFCADNGLQMIIRAHECVMDGLERFASGCLITVFSATNYCGTVGNAGAILIVGKDLQVQAKILMPKAVGPTSPSSPLSCQQFATEVDAEAEEEEEGKNGGSKRPDSSIPAASCATESENRSGQQVEDNQTQGAGEARVQDQAQEDKNSPAGAQVQGQQAQEEGSKKKSEPGKNARMNDSSIFWCRELNRERPPTPPRNSRMRDHLAERVQ